MGAHRVSGIKHFFLHGFKEILVWEDVTLGLNSNVARQFRAPFGSFPWTDARWSGSHLTKAAFIEL